MTVQGGAAESNFWLSPSEYKAPVAHVIDIDRAARSERIHETVAQFKALGSRYRQAFGAGWVSYHSWSNADSRVNLLFGTTHNAGTITYRSFQSVEAYDLSLDATVLTYTEYAVSPHNEGLAVQTASASRPFTVASWSEYNLQGCPLLFKDHEHFAIFRGLGSFSMLTVEEPVFDDEVQVGSTAEMHVQLQKDYKDLGVLVGSFALLSSVTYDDLKGRLE